MNMKQSSITLLNFDAHFSTIVVWGVLAIAIWLAPNIAHSQPTPKNGTIVQSEDRTITFFGELTLARARRIEAAIRSGSRTLVIESSAGDAAAGLELADVIHSNGVKVIAEGFCISSCANYILPASSAPELRGTVLLGFHNSLTSSYLVATSQRANISPGALRVLELQSRAERAFYKKLGIDQRLLTAPTYALLPKCAVIATIDGRYDVDVAFSGPSLWVPSPEALSELHYKTIGTAPASPERFTIVYGPQLKSSKEGLWKNWSISKVRTADVQTLHSLNRARIESTLRTLPRCAKGIVESPSMQEAMETTSRIARNDDN